MRLAGNLTPGTSDFQIEYPVRAAAEDDPGTAIGPRVLTSRGLRRHASLLLQSHSCGLRPR